MTRANGHGDNGHLDVLQEPAPTRVLDNLPPPSAASTVSPELATRAKQRAKQQMQQNRGRSSRCVCFFRLYEGAPLMTEQAMYIPTAQVNAQYLSLVHVWFQPDWVVRTAGPVEGLTAQMQRALSSADPNLPFSGFYSMSDLLAKILATQRIEVALLSAMAALALLLSVVGIFALVANIVALVSLLI